jgi:hypothetical protein
VETTVLARPTEIRFVQLLESFKREGGEWPEWCQTRAETLKGFSPKLMHWRAVDLIEFVCTNGRAIYRLKSFDDKRLMWLLHREYEED